MTGSNAQFKRFSTDLESKADFEFFADDFSLNHVTGQLYTTVTKHVTPRIESTMFTGMS